MYKFVTIEGSCNSPYDINACEGHANRMAAEGYFLVQVYQTTIHRKGCCTAPKSVLVMVFRQTA
jgi:hypothetical protein